jgi:hypothetical protein
MLGSLSKTQLFTALYGRRAPHNSITKTIFSAIAAIDDFITDKFINLGPEWWAASCSSFLRYFVAIKKSNSATPRLLAGPKMLLLLLYCLFVGKSLALVEL